MIPATRPYVATYRHIGKNGNTYYTRKPVIAWDDDGRALVCDDENTGRLVPADHYTNFAEIQASEETKYVAAIPGGGWRLAWKNEDGSELIEPVLAWIIGADGEGRALCVAEGAYVDVIDPFGDGAPRSIAPGDPIIPKATGTMSGGETA